MRRSACGAAVAAVRRRLATLIRQIDADEARRGDEHDDQRQDEEQQVERDPGLDPISLPPVVSAPNSSAASTTPLGRRPGEQRQRDRVEPDARAEMSCDSWPTVPSTCIEPPRPARPPDSDIASIIEPPALMPAYRAAVRLKPAARSSKPLVVRNRNHETTAAMSSATTKP